MLGVVGGVPGNRAPIPIAMVIRPHWLQEDQGLRAQAIRVTHQSRIERRERDQRQSGRLPTVAAWWSARLHESTAI